MSVWPNHYSLDIYEAPCYRMNRSQGSQLGTSACIQRLTNQNFATSNIENLATWLFFLKLVEVNLTLQSRHRIYSSEYIQKSCKIIRVYMMPQEGLSEFVEMTLCDLYVVVEMQESHRDTGGWHRRNHGLSIRASTPKPHRDCDCVVRHGKGDIVDVVKVRENCLD